MNVSTWRESDAKQHVYVTLSARNVQHLQRMLDNGAGTSITRQDGSCVLHVSVETDAVHYANREAGPGYRQGA